MSVVNALLRPLFDGLLYPFRGLDPIWGLSVMSLLAAIGMLLMFKATSNQTALEQVKRQIHAGLFEIRLWNDDMRAILRAQSAILRHNLSYLRYSLVPMVWIIVPLFLVVAQLQFHYGYGGLEPGRTAVLELRLRPDVVAAGAPKPTSSLETDGGVAVETPAVWSPSGRELAWRIRAEQPGSHELRIEVADTTYVKSVVVATDVRRRSPRKVISWLDQLVFPAEPPLPSDGEVESIEIAYPDAEVSLLGWKSHWLVHFFILTIVFAFLLRRPMGVTI